MYTSSWRVFTTASTISTIGLAFDSVAGAGGVPYYTRNTAGTASGGSFPALGSNHGLFLTGASGAVALIRASGPQGASIGTFTTQFAPYFIAGASTTVNGAAGITFLQTASNLTASTASGYGFTWNTLGGMALVRYGAGLSGASTVLASTATQVISVGQGGAMRVSWNASAGGVQLKAYAQAGSSFSFASTILSAWDSAAPILPASGASGEGLVYYTQLSCFLMVASTTMTGIRVQDA